MRADIWRTGHGSDGQLELTPIEDESTGNPGESSLPPVARDSARAPASADIYDRVDELLGRIDRHAEVLDTIAAGVVALKGRAPTPEPILTLGPSVNLAGDTYLLGGSQ